MTKQVDYFGMVHCCELSGRDYNIFGELQDGTKNLLFTVKKHPDYCDICNKCTVDCCLFKYVCCDNIVFQMDYMKNNIPFYTQGINQKKGCYPCGFCLTYTCYCCRDCCCTPQILLLRENPDANNPDFEIGTKKGRTQGFKNICMDSRITYINQDENNGPSVAFHAGCCECCSFCLCSDIPISLENATGQKIGTILIPNGLCSQKVPSCYVPRNHYEINLEQNISSVEKFQIIADVVHFDLLNRFI